VTHCFLFWGGDVRRAFKSAKHAKYDDRHHAYMAKTYREAPWWWYIGLLVFSFVLGLVVVITQNITLPAWAYIVSLLLGMFIAPFSTLLYSRYGNGIATNNLSKVRGPAYFCEKLLLTHREDVGRFVAPGKAHRQHVLCCVVAQCHQQHR
jgi:hypothetical protein